MTYPDRIALARAYMSPPRPIGVYRHGLNRGDVLRALEAESARIVQRWLETSNPPVPRAVADVLILGRKCAAR